MATSATPMPTVASWPISMGQASCHKAAASSRILVRVNLVGMSKASRLETQGCRFYCESAHAVRRCASFGSKLDCAASNRREPLSGIQGLLSDAWQQEIGHRG